MSEPTTTITTATRRIISAIACLALALSFSFAGTFAAPADAYAASGKTAQTLTTAGTGTLDRGDPGKLGGDNLSLTSGSAYAGEIGVVWHLPMLPYAHEFTGKTLTVRYHYAGDAKSAKSKTVAFKDDRAGFLEITNLKWGKKAVIQVRLNGTYNGKTMHGAWSSPMTRTVSAKPKAPSSAKLTALSSGKVKATWKANKIKGLTSQSYTVRYAYAPKYSGTDRHLLNSKAKTVKGITFTTPVLKKGKTVYVQVRANAKYKGKTVRSSWSTTASIKVKA